MKKYTNPSNLPLSIAIWLMHDEYEHDYRPNVLSATSIIKPIRELVLAASSNNVTEEVTVDISSLIASKIGTSIHNNIEYAWKNSDVKKALKALNHSNKLIDNITINPKEVKEGDFPIYFENRVEKEIDGFIISGKYDFIENGTLTDFKSTKVYTWISGSNTEQYQIQGSIYRWLNPDKITNDIFYINYIFTDWSKKEAIKDSNYPQERVLSKAYTLMSIEDTEEYLRNKLNSIKHYLKYPEELPECTKEQLWQDDTVYKYYKKSDASRATKVSKNYYEVYDKYIQDGSIGNIITFPGKVRKCTFCTASNHCEQRNQLFQEGLID